jgi:acyl carrier protein
MKISKISWFTFQKQGEKKMKQLVLDKIISIVRDELELKGSDIDENSTLFELGIDSILLMSIIVYTEEEFQYEAEEDALIGDSFKRVGDIVDYIVRKAG